MLCQTELGVKRLKVYDRGAKFQSLSSYLPGTGLIEIFCFLKMLVKTLCREEPEKKREKRTWESWSVEDKNNFFDGLKQYGRDFGKIKCFMSVKAGKDCQVKVEFCFMLLLTVL